jgi:uncharacterized membrane protein
MEDINNLEETQHEESVSRSRLFLIIGWIAAIISLFAYPFIFGILGVTMGILTTKRGNRSGLYLIIFSIVLMGIGLIFSGVIMNYTRHFLGIG